MSQLKIIRSWETPKELPFLVKDILIAANPVGRTSGVYFLIKNNEVVYVGATTNYHERIGRHLAAKKIIFDSVAFIRVEDEAELWDLESRYITYFNCEANKVKP